MKTMRTLALWELAYAANFSNGKPRVIENIKSNAGVTRLYSNCTSLGYHLLWFLESILHLETGFVHPSISKESLASTLRLKPLFKHRSRRLPRAFSGYVCNSVVLLGCFPIRFRIIRILLVSESCLCFPFLDPRVHQRSFGLYQEPQIMREQVSP